MRELETFKEGKEKVKLVISCRGYWENLSPAPPGAPADEEAAPWGPTLAHSLLSLLRFFHPGVSMLGSLASSGRCQVVWWKQPECLRSNPSSDIY